MAHTNFPARASISASTAFVMAVASSVFIYTYDRLWEVGVGSDGFGAGIIGQLTIWLQPWLWFAVAQGVFVSWPLSAFTSALIGAVSGVFLSIVVFAAVWRWPRLFWPSTLLWSLLAFCSVGHALHNFIFHAEAFR